MKRGKFTNMKNKAILALMFLCLLAGAAMGAPAFNLTGNPADTTAETTVTFNGGQNTLDFINPNATPEQTLTAPTLEFSVAREAGFLYDYDPLFLPTIQYTTPGVPVTWEVVVTNEGNSNLTLNVKKTTIVTNPPGLTGWTVKFIDGTAKDAISKALNEDTDLSFKFVITPSTVETESPDGSTGTVTITITNEQGYPLAGYTSEGFFYTGVNGKKYGGLVTSEERGEAEIEAPVMTLWRTQTINAPITYTGGIHDAVPGSVITYTISYENTGAAAARDVIIIDKVPTDTQGYHVNKTEQQTNVTIEAVQGTAVDWRVYYSTNPSPLFTYGNYANWTLLGTLDAGTYSWIVPTTLETYVKWEKASVGSPESGTLTWGVIIK
jgi:uncharacterized repeat protein (TIGR01451 family)